MERTVVPKRQNEGTCAVAKLCVTEGASGYGRAGCDDDLLEPEFDVPFVHHHVDELGDVGTQHERRQRAAPML